MRTLFTKFMLTAALLLVFPALLTAQTAATVTGEVTDSSGAVLPGTVVVLSNPSTGVEYKATTNSAGSYHFGEIPPGPGYTMTFTHDGFSAYTVKNVYVIVANSRTQFSDFDACVAKSFAILPKEGVNLKFRADAYNVLNHPNFNSPGDNSTADDVSNPGSFGNMTAVPTTGNNGAPRVLQLALRLEF